MGLRMFPDERVVQSTNANSVFVAGTKLPQGLVDGTTNLAGTGDGIFNFSTVPPTFVANSALVRTMTNYAVHGQISPTDTLTSTAVDFTLDANGGNPITIDANSNCYRWLVIGNLVNTSAQTTMYVKFGSTNIASIVCAVNAQYFWLEVLLAHNYSGAEAMFTNLVAAHYGGAAQVSGSQNLTLVCNPQGSITILADVLTSMPTKVQ